MSQDDDKLTVEGAVSMMQAFIDFHTAGMPEDNFDTTFNKTLKVRTAVLKAPGVSAKAVFEFKIPRQYSNTPAGPQTIHGGAIATFFDITTSMAICACDVPGWQSTGVSRNLAVTYYKPPLEGDDCIIEAEVMSIGRSVATVRGVMRRESDGAVLATCHHDRMLARIPETKL
jgi:acyl-coenzyme A thioesterase 13